MIRIQALTNTRRTSGKCVNKRLFRGFESLPFRLKIKDLRKNKIFGLSLFFQPRKGFWGVFEGI